MIKQSSPPGGIERTSPGRRVDRLRLDADCLRQLPTASPQALHPHLAYAVSAIAYRQKTLSGYPDVPVFFRALRGLLALAKAKLTW